MVTLYENVLFLANTAGMRGDDSQGFNLISNDSSNKVHQPADTPGYGKWQRTDSWEFR